jgi:hypothetical protein
MHLCNLCEIIVVDDSDVSFCFYFIFYVEFSIRITAIYYYYQGIGDSNHFGKILEIILTHTVIRQVKQLILVAKLYKSGIAIDSATKK